MYATLHADRRHAAGYQWPNQRDGCRHCRHCCARLSAVDRRPIGYDCQLGRFPVAAGGICNHHQAASAATTERIPS